MKTGVLVPQKGTDRMDIRFHVIPPHLGIKIPDGDIPSGI